MANEDWKTVAELINPLVVDGHKYKFYQALRWLHSASRTVSENGITPFKLKVLPVLDLDFVANDIHSIKFNANTNEVEITVTFMGLYGTASPLPIFYSEDLILEVEEDVTVSKDFLDMFHKILYQKLYDVWLKYRINQCVFENKKNDYISRVYHLLGIGDKTLRKLIPNAKRLTKYLGLFNQQSRSANALEILLKDYFDVPVEIVSNYKSVNKICYEQQANLGDQNCRVGKDIYLGSEITDCNISIAIKIGLLTMAQFNLFSYDQQYARALAFLIRFFLKSPIRCHISIFLHEGEVKLCALGVSSDSRLGQNIWVAPSKRQVYEAHYEIN